MTSPNEQETELLQRLVREAQRLWGDERARQLQASLEQQARNLHQIATHLPNSSLTPGFYQ